MQQPESAGTGQGKLAEGTTETTETTEEVDLGAVQVDEATHALLQQLYLEVDQQANLAPRQLDVGKKLRLVNWQHLVDSPELDDHLVHRPLLPVVAATSGVCAVRPAPRPSATSAPSKPAAPHERLADDPNRRFFGSNPATRVPLVANADPRGRGIAQRRKSEPMEETQ